MVASNPRTNHLYEYSVGDVTVIVLNPLAYQYQLPLAKYCLGARLPVVGPVMQVGEELL